MPTRKVRITLTNKIVASYEARSYPRDYQTDANWIELYKVPVYKIIVEGTDNSGTDKTIIHQAPRFMPYWNDPKALDPAYATKGWANSGLSSARTIIVSRYIRDYEVHNRYTPGKGAIVLKGSFYIHAGPGILDDVGFGSAGCVEIVGNYDTFKFDIASLAGATSPADSDNTIQNLVSERHLTVVIEAATAPDIKSLFSRKVSRQSIFGP